MPLEHQVRLYLYLSTMSVARTQYLIERLNLGENSSHSIWSLVIKNKKSSKKVFIPIQTEVSPAWMVWPEGLNPDIWRDFLIRSSRLSVDVLILSFILKKSDSEIAEILSITEGGVLIALSEGLARLGEYIK